jgi:putative methyltransferase
MNISYIYFKVPEQVVVYVYFWLSVKTYVEDNYKGNIKWNWCYPINDSDFESTEAIADQVLSTNPTVVAISLYMWNHALSLAVAKIIKSKNKDVIIVVGGPHVEYNRPDYFINNKFIDFCCQTDGYGEVFFNEFLYQLETDKDWHKVPFLKSSKMSSNAIFNKRDFQWPRHIFSKNKNYFLMRGPNRQGGSIVYETSRGCPYSCSYCEWGGGIGSKVSFKPLEYILEDLDFLFNTANILIFGLIDANFGIIERDVEIAQTICEFKSKVGYPAFVNIYGSSKKNKHHVYAIESMFAEHKLKSDFKISLQDFNPEVVKNISRTDTPWQQQLPEYVRMQQKFPDIDIRFELILGLPGTTVDDYYTGLNIICPHGYVDTRYVWQLLPTSPAAATEFIEKFSIKTLLVHQSWENQSNDKSLIYDLRYAQPSKIVIETYSYTKEDWVEMFIMDRIMMSTEEQGFLKPISKYMNEKMNIPYSVFYKRYWDTFINNDTHTIGPQKVIFSNIIEHCRERLNQQIVDDIENFLLPAPFSGMASITTHHNSLVHLNKKLYYAAITKWIEDEFWLDNELIDVIKQASLSRATRHWH